MRKIITTTFVTLDGVMQAPGGPEEDTSNGFTYGGWELNSGYAWDEAANSVMDKLITTPFEMLLGRVTYDIFAPYWPNHPEIEKFATPFNSTKKYVVSHKSFEPSWSNTTVITGDVVSEIKALKELDAPDLLVWGSGNLIQTLLQHHLVDQMYIWTYPITLGMGKKLFAEGTQPQNFEAENILVTASGIVIATYNPSKQL